MSTINITYGPHDLTVEDFTLNISEWAAAFKDVLSLGNDAVPFRNGQPANWNDAVQAGDRVEFVKVRGKKGCDVLSKREFCLRYFVSEEEWQTCLKNGLRVGTHEGVVVVIPEQGVEVLQQVRQTAGDGTTTSNGLRLDETTLQCQWSDMTCRLRPKLFALLKRLARKPGKYVSMNSILDEIWNDRVAGYPTVQKTASDLQRALSQAGMNELQIDGRSNPGFYRLRISSSFHSASE